VEQYLLHKTKSANDVVVAVELRALTEVLGNAYEQLKQLALKASVRKSQLILFSLSSEIYKYYMEEVFRVQALEKRLFCPFKIESYPDEFYVVDFNNIPKTDNSQEIFLECIAVKQEIEKVYYDALSNPLMVNDQKKQLQKELDGLHNCFLKIK
jgi:hypothetical protein